MARLFDMKLICLCCSCLGMTLRNGDKRGKASVVTCTRSMQKDLDLNSSNSVDFFACASSHAQLSKGALRHHACLRAVILCTACYVRALSRQ